MPSTDRRLLGRSRRPRCARRRDGIGAFATRTPHRPNPLHICTRLLLDRTDWELRVRGLDALDGSPVVDPKPALQAEQ
ncbi:TrmO family methyltransferase domain-containing protein [Natrinema salifodinae]|uniref:TrmO family methyltransferase domain-containing protein n=1 Tax=Natrinema salifodinae TaxID=1202768 RepID=UPI0019D3A241